MSQDPIARPAPTVSRDAAFFWEGAKQSELRIQSCNACGELHHPPRPMCNACLATDMGYQVMSGRGTVYSWIKPVHPPLPMFDEGFIVTLVDLEEGPRLMSNLCEIEFEDVRKGMAVEVFFVPAQDGFMLPQFRPVRA